jgi:hypothetical protein
VVRVIQCGDQCSRAVLEAGGQVKDDFSEFDSDWDEEEF